MKGPQGYVNHLQARNYFCSSVPESWMNMNSEFNYFLASSSRDPFACQEKRLLSKNVMLLLQGPHKQDSFPPNPACLAGNLQRLLFTTWQTCTSHPYVTQYLWKLFSYFLETWGQILVPHGLTEETSLPYARSRPWGIFRVKRQRVKQDGYFWVLYFQDAVSWESNLYLGTISYLPVLRWRRKNPKEMVYR